jgi:predicted kinase
LPLVAKDDIKEALGDLEEAIDLVRSRQLGRAAYAVMRAITERSLAMGGSLVVEANFHRDPSQLWLKELLPSCEARFVLCSAPLQVARARFAARMSVRSRHAVHLDAEILEEEWPDLSEFELELGVPSLRVDTSSRYVPDLDSIVRFIA